MISNRPPNRSTNPGRGLTAAVAMALLVVAISACSDSNEESASTEIPSSDATPPAAEAAGPVDDEIRIIGKAIVDGDSHSLTKAHWCEPEAGYEDGTTVAIRVIALDESGDVRVYGIQVDGDGGDSTSRITVATDPNTNYASEGLGRQPTILMENGAVRLAGWVYRPGRDPVEVEVEFSLPEQPGFPGYC